MPAVDIARSLALVAMAIYHCIYDLVLFGVLPRAVAFTGGFRWLAIVTAASFLFLAGIGLMLAHRDRLHLIPALRRIAVIAAAAALVTLATYVAMPGAWVFFGILHCIAGASLVGLLLVRAPGGLTLLVAAAVFALPLVYSDPLFDRAPLLWTGLGTRGVNTVDYEPAFPWFAATFAGIALVQLTRKSAFWRPRPETALTRIIAWPGRHSLAIYLIHQPVLIGLIWSAVRLGLLGP